jgi:predicted ATPase/DNA-binding SARP family transcriptional activator
MEFRILGPVEVVSDGRPVPLGPPKQRALLVELLHGRGGVSRDRLIASLWHDEPPKSAVGSLQVYVHGLRRALGERRIETVGAGYRLALDEDDRVDADELAALVERARSALDDRPVAALADVAAALELWRGPPLADVADAEALATYARELAERRVEALELRNEAWLATGRHDLVLDDIDRLVREEPFRERLRAQQILALYRDGRQADALAAYRATRDTWAEELGLDPTPALRELERAVLRQDEALATPVAERTQTRRLPSPPNRLVGRRLEISAVAALLRSQSRLVTLVGAGGTGKTRLALAVAEELAAEVRDGVAFVDLAPVHDPRLLLAAIAHELEAAAETVAADLAERELLLVLDNMEQLVGAASDVATLLAGAPRLRILATSRTPLRIAAEHEYQVRPLPVPREDASQDEIARAEAVQLFVARARAVGATVAPDGAVAALVRRLDGLPLALELAAARAKLLSPPEILDRIEHDLTLLATPARDVPPRQSTLAATIGWSLDLLDDEERHAFARLGVFAGGCTVDAAAHLGVGLDLLGSLVDKSLVQRRDAAGRARFAMLETVRPFALAQLDGQTGEGTRRAHAEWVTGLAERIEEGLLPGDTASRIDELEAEVDNVRAALRWTIDAGAHDLALRLISSTRPFWEIRGHLPEGSRWLDEILDAAADATPGLRAKALGFAGTAALRRGSIETAERRWQEMLDLYEQLDDRDGIARGLSDVGTAAAARGDWERSRDLLEQAAALFRELDEPKRLAVALSNLGHVAGQVGDSGAAAAYTLEALEVQRLLGDEQRQAISLNNLASFAADAGDHADARRRLDECLELALRLGYREVVAHALVTRARIALAEGDVAETVRAAAAADAVFAEAGVQMPGSEGERFAELKDEARAAVGEDAYAALAAEGVTRPVVAALGLSR